VLAHHVVREFANMSEITDVTFRCVFFEEEGEGQVVWSL